MKKIQETLKFSIFEVFEKMFYIFLEPLDEESIGYDMEAGIRFDGCLKGEIRILLSKDMAENMIQNMLGLEKDEITSQIIEDCTKEAANMICGNFLGKYDSTKVFNLSIPTFVQGRSIRPVPKILKDKISESGEMNITDIATDEKDWCMDFGSDGGRVAVIIDTKGSV